MPRDQAAKGVDVDELKVAVERRAGQHGLSVDRLPAEDSHPVVGLGQDLLLWRGQRPGVWRLALAPDLGEAAGGVGADELEVAVPEAVARFVPCGILLVFLICLCVCV